MYKITWVDLVKKSDASAKFFKKWLKKNKNDFKSHEVSNYFSVVDSGNAKLFSCLKGYVSSFNLTDNRGRTALHYAAANANIQLVEFLLAHDAEIIKDNEGNTPLHLITNPDMVPVLANRAGMNLSVHNKRGESALDLALLKLDNGCLLAFLECYAANIDRVDLDKILTARLETKYHNQAYFHLFCHSTRFEAGFPKKINHRDSKGRDIVLVLAAYGNVAFLNTIIRTSEFNSKITYLNIESSPDLSLDYGSVDSVSSNFFETKSKRINLMLNYDEQSYDVVLTAIAHDRVDMLEYLSIKNGGLKLSLDDNFTQEHPLEVAIKHNSINVFKTLFNQPSLYSPWNHADPVMDVVAKYGRLEILEFIYKSEPYTFNENAIFRLFMLAVENGHDRLLRVFIKSKEKGGFGWKVNSKYNISQYDITVLVRAAISSGHLNVLNVLLDKNLFGYNLGRGFDAIVTAIETGPVSIMRELLTPKKYAGYGLELPRNANNPFHDALGLAIILGRYDIYKVLTSKEDGFKQVYFSLNWAMQALCHCKKPLSRDSFIKLLILPELLQVSNTSRGLNWFFKNVPDALKIKSAMLYISEYLKTPSTDLSLLLHFIKKIYVNNPEDLEFKIFLKTIFKGLILNLIVDQAQSLDFLIPECDLVEHGYANLVIGDYNIGMKFYTKAAENYLKSITDDKSQVKELAALKLGQLIYSGSVRIDERVITHKAMPFLKHQISFYEGDFKSLSQREHPVPTAIILCEYFHGHSIEALDYLKNVHDILKMSGTFWPKKIVDDYYEYYLMKNKALLNDMIYLKSSELYYKFVAGQRVSLPSSFKTSSADKSLFDSFSTSSIEESSGLEASESSDDSSAKSPKI